MPKERPRSGNLSRAAWQSLRDLKFNATSAEIQPTLSDVTVAAVAIAQRHRDEFMAALEENE